VNIKERLDFSCAVFAHDGTLVANAPHMPQPVSARDCAENNRRKISTGQVCPRMIALSKLRERQNH
jgi:5-oxoprolinase (ATP-hydrolysing)